MKLTAQLKLLPTAAQAKALLATMGAMNAAATHAARIGFGRKVYGQVSIHHVCYLDLRARFGLPSNLAIRSIAKAVEAFARDKTTCPVFKPDGAVPYSDRVYRIVSAQEVSLATTTGRIRVPFVVGAYFAEMLNRKRGEADLVYRDGMFFLCVTVEFEEPPPVEPVGFLGVDMGIVEIATTSEGQSFTGAKVEKVRQRFSKTRRNLQRRGTKSAKRILQRIRRREARFRRHENHCIAKSIVATAKALGLGIAVEDLNGIRERVTVGHRERAKHSGWAFWQLRAMIEYKARLAGVPFEAVDPRNSSRTCSACDHCDKGNRKTQSAFVCLHCGHSMNADQNAAINLAARAKVNSPRKQRTVRLLSATV